LIKIIEITALPKLLNLLILKAYIISIDVMNSLKEMAKQIIEAKADYILALKKMYFLKEKVTLLKYFHCE
jgi:predicted transposase YbfD/YdcC